VHFGMCFLSNDIYKQYLIVFFCTVHRKLHSSVHPAFFGSVAASMPMIILLDLVIGEVHFNG
jgi:hypothetical protein